MKPFDPKKRRGSDDQRSSYRSGNSFHRDDSRNSDSDTLSDFTRDKRPRVNRERKFGTDERPQGSRHSFNPYFTRDNRLKRDDNERPQSYRSSYERSRQEGER
ncbi:MAG: pseudouridine synthase, partial [Alistipes sp.]|nr:pseudouridine synthase [Alistipes sp.]